MAAVSSEFCRSSADWPQPFSCSWSSDPRCSGTCSLSPCARGRQHALPSRSQLCLTFSVWPSKKSRGSPVGGLVVSKEEEALFWSQVTHYTLQSNFSSKKTDTIICLISLLGSIFQFGTTKKDGQVNSPYQDPHNFAKSN